MTEPETPKQYARRLVIRVGTPEFWWTGLGQRPMQLLDVYRAERIIQLRDDGTYRIVKDSRSPSVFSPANEVLFVYADMEAED